MTNTHTAPAAKARSRDRIWIFLGSDGRHVNAGRHSDPTDEEITEAGKGIAGQGLTGWLAIREGDYYSRRAKVNLLRVRSITPREGDWDAAVRAFEEHRQRYLANVLG